MNEELKRIFGNAITVNGKQIPTAHLRYRGDSKTFVTWTILSERPVLSADDGQVYSVGEVDVDIYSDGNYMDIVSEVKKLMEDNDWLWTEDSPEMYEEDTGLYHRTSTFEKERSL